MSVRGLNFLQKWMDDNLPHQSSSNPTLARELARRAARDARKAGIPPEEISEEVGSIFTIMLEALEGRDNEPEA